MKPITNDVPVLDDVQIAMPFNVRTELQSWPLEEIQAYAKNTALPFAVALANLTGDLNTGNIIRSAAIFGAEQVYVFGRKRYDRRSTVGAHHYVPVQHHIYEDIFDWEATLQTIRLSGYTPILVEQAGKYPMHEFKLQSYHPVCLVFGPENVGIPTEICQSEQSYHIPQYGVLRSLNVATAAGIAMYHVMQQFVSEPSLASTLNMHSQ